MSPDRAITVPTGAISARQQTSRRIHDAVPPRRLEAPGLLLDDGSVVVPAALAGEVLRALARHVTERARVDGGQASPACRALLSALYEAERGPVADDGHDQEESGSLDGVTDMVTASQMAERSGYSARTLRRWAASGRLRARRVGRTWLIDSQSLTEGPR